MELFPLWAAAVIVLAIVATMTYLMLSERRGRGGDDADRDRPDEEDGDRPD